jgi:hypothetical protein
MDLDTFSAMVVTFQIRSILRPLQVPLAMCDYVGRSVTFHGHFNMKERTEAALVRVPSVALTDFCKRRTQRDLNPKTVNF